MPSIAVTALYWKAWTVLLIWAAHNRETIGKALWENYPTLRYMMQMMMTKYVNCAALLLFTLVCLVITTFLRLPPGPMKSRWKRSPQKMLTKQ